MPLGTEAWTSSTIVVIAVASALIGIASMNSQRRSYDETIAKLRSTLDLGSEADPTGDGIIAGDRPERP